MWWCEDKLNRKTAHFRLLSVAQKRCVLKFTIKHPRRRRQQERHKFPYITMENNNFTRFARAFFIFKHFADVLVLSTTWNDLFCSCLDDVSIWWQMFNFVFLPLKRWFQFNSRIVRTHFANVMILNNWEMIAEMRSYIFRWPSGFRRHRLCLSSLLGKLGVACYLHICKLGVICYLNRIPRCLACYEWMSGRLLAVQVVREEWNLFVPDYKFFFERWQ